MDLPIKRMICFSIANVANMLSTDQMPVKALDCHPMCAMYSSDHCIAMIHLERS